MQQLKIGIQLANLRQPVKAALATAARLGARGVEIDARNEFRPQEMSQTGLRQIRKMLDDLNLRVSAVSFQTRRGYDVVEELDRRVAATKAAMKLARQLGADVVVNQIGRVPEDEQSPQWQTLVEVLSDLGAAGQHIGAMLAAKTGTESGADLARLMAALPEGAMGVDLHPGNLIAGGFSPSEAVKLLGPRILHVHAADGVRDLAQGRGIEVQLGRGSTDFPALLGELEEHGYRGWFTIERHGAEDPIAEIQDAVKYFESLYQL